MRQNRKLLNVSVFVSHVKTAICDPFDRADIDAANRPAVRSVVLHRLYSVSHVNIPFSNLVTVE